MSRHVLESGQQEGEELFICHAVILDLLSVCGFIRDIVRWVRHDQVGFDAFHEHIHRVRIGAVTAHHLMPAQRPYITRLYIWGDGFRVKFAVVVMGFFVMNFTEKVIHLGSVKTGRAKVVPCRLQVFQQIGKGYRLPVTGRFVQGDVERFFIFRLFDMNHNAVHLSRAFSLEHLIALMTTDNVAGDLVPDDRIAVPEVVQAPLDLFIGRIARLQVFPGIVFCGFQLVNWQPPHIQGRIHGFLLHRLRAGFLFPELGLIPPAPNLSEIRA